MSQQSENTKKNPEKSYLDNLKFDPKLQEAWWAKYIVNIRYVLLLILTILVVGLASYFSLPTRLNPEIKIPIVGVTTILPGAGPEDVESLVTKPLEDELAGLEGLTTMTSGSRDGVSSITLEFTSNTDAEKARQDAQNAVDLVNDLPEDATEPQVQKFDFENQPVWQFVLYGKDVQPPALLAYAKRLQDAIESSSKVKEVTLNGYETQEIQVIVKPEKARELGISPTALFQSVRAATGSFPAGTIQANGSAFSLSVDPQVRNVAELRNLRITTGTGADVTVMRLGDVAEISERSAANEPQSFFADSSVPPSRVVSFNVFKTSSSNIDEAEKAIKEIVDREIEATNGTFAVKTTLNTAEEITEQFSDLVHNFRDTIILVFIVLVAFLGFRQALIASFTIPLTFLSAFFFMRMFGLSINFLTLFSLLLALGLLIDDTVVTVQAMTSYDKTRKFTPQQTGILVWRDFIVPIWSTTITTIWAFLPLLLASGIIGEFIKSIPIVVTVTLISSTAIAVLVTLPLMIYVLKPSVPRRVKIMIQIVLGLALFGLIIALSPKNAVLPFIVLGFILLFIVIRTVGGILRERFTARLKQNKKLDSGLQNIGRGFSNGFINMEGFLSAYEKAIARIITSKRWRRAVLAMVVLFAIFSYALVPLGFVVNEFFPKSDEDIFYINVEYPPGTSLEKTNKEAVYLTDRVRKYQGVKYVTADVGTNISTDGGGSAAGASNLLMLTVDLKEKNSIDLATQFRRDFADYQKGELSVVELSGGPPAGSDLQIKLSGDDLSVLNQYANKIQDFLDKQDGVINVQKSIKPGTSKLVFVPDYNQLAANGLSQADIGGQLRTFASGTTLDSITIGDEERDIVFRYANTSQSPQSLSGFTIQDRTGKAIPLTSLGQIQLKTNPTLITRENQKRTLSVSAGVTVGYSSVQINQKLEEFARNDLNLPPGYSWATGGVNEENAKSVQSILQAMILAFILIFASMVLQFGSFRQAVLALLVIPFAISGVFIVFAVTATPLSFPALIGVLALFGIVVTHSIMLLDKINLNLASGMGFTESIADAGASRLEPILLTSLLTIVGLVPITLSDPFWRGLGGAIIAGLIFTGAIKLFFIPIVYYMWFHPKNEKEGK